MPQFDPRREPLRFAPSLAAISLAICVAGVTMGTRAEPAAKGSKPAAASEKAAPAKPSKPEAKPAKAAAKPAKTAAKADPKAEDKAEAKSVKVAVPPADKPTKVAAKPADKPAKASAKPKKPEVTRVAAAKPTAAEDTASAKPAEGKPAAKPAEAPGPSYGAAQTIKVKLRKGETLEAAIRRAEAAPDDAKAAAAKVEKALGAPAKPGQLFSVDVAPREGRVGAGRLMKLTLKTGGEPVVLTRGDKGAMTVAARSAPADSSDGETDPTPTVRAERAQLISGEVRGSLFASARRAGVSGGQVGEIVRVFAAKLDFQRDLKAGDRFTVVHDDKGQLLYARIKSKGSYRFARSGGQVMWLDEDGKSLKSGLLRTPVDGARMSSRFGMRRHPILGYQRMHQGIDFAAASGTPIMAAGDGVVTKIGRWGGYGNWLQIRHSGGYESGYAHLSRYASGLKVGDKVKQGELVAYVGSTGASTGPHLHHEIWLNGKRVDPKGARIPQGFALEGRELVAFQAQRAKVQATLKQADTRLARGKAKVAGLRPAKDADTAA